MQEEQLEQVIIAGALGNYINLSSAIAIGMLLALRVERFAQIGNAAGVGAKLALISDPHGAGGACGEWRTLPRRCGGSG